jgi:hypothetical protein
MNTFAKSLYPVGHTHPTGVGLVLVLFLHCFKPSDQQIAHVQLDIKFGAPLIIHTESITGCFRAIAVRCSLKAVSYRRHTAEALKAEAI